MKTFTLGLMLAGTTFLAAGSTPSAAGDLCFRLRDGGIVITFNDPCGPVHAVAPVHAATTVSGISPRVIPSGTVTPLPVTTTPVSSVRPPPGQPTVHTSPPPPPGQGTGTMAPPPPGQPRR